jgi:ABC-2 type transport system ATP-binding protein
VLEVLHLSKRFSGIAVVDDVSFNILPGEILGYVGPNGAGKSTTVKMLIGLIEPSSGQILYRARSIRQNLREYQQNIG